MSLYSELNLNEKYILNLKIDVVGEENDMQIDFTRNSDGMSHLITAHLSFRDLYLASYTKGFFKRW